MWFIIILLEILKLFVMSKLFLTYLFSLLLSFYSTQYISRIFIKTEMLLKSRSALNSGSKQLIKSRSSDNLPTSQSQVNIQMMSHTLTIREVGKRESSALSNRTAHTQTPRIHQKPLRTTQTARQKRRKYIYLYI